ncbi:MAG: nucleotidyl transferase AbiEii/AbiGii toxin family protein [Anaerovibrio sp.]
MRNADSIKARLKNIAKETGRTMQDVLIAYGLERTIMRLTKSRHVENFTLKGGIFLYALMDGEFARATTDIDLLAQGISNDIDQMQEVFCDIFSVKLDDPLRYDLDSLSVKSITEFKYYHGVNATINAYLDHTKIQLSIDVGFGDVIYPGRVVMDFPVILSEENPRVYTYSLSSIIAEKFEAIVSLGYENSRFKDFYDIYILSGKYDVDGSELMEACKETFCHRHTSFDDIAAFEDDYASDSVRQSRWKSFAKKKKVQMNVTLEETIEQLRAFVEPVVAAINCKEKFMKTWKHDSKSWEQGRIKQFCPDD